MEFDNSRPIYLQIVEKIKKDIISGKLERGDKMPSVRVMASELKVNVNTVQRVYQQLEQEEVIFTQRGIGSFVTRDEQVVKRIKQEMSYELLENFVQGMKELGFDSSQILKLLTKYMEGEPGGSIKGR
ncbi:MAG: GntR family transcriptional regulator [Clostridia bacterium]|nr:GntR family transcriptional regulator [Clostridia bacterium]